MFQRNLDLMGALQTYTLLTVGSGLAVQVPSLLVSTAAGLIITRNANEGELGASAVKQLSNYNALLASSVVIGLMMFIPGVPKFPFILVAAVLGGGALLRSSIGQKAAIAAGCPRKNRQPRHWIARRHDGSVVIDPLELEVGYGLIPLVDENAAIICCHQITKYPPADVERAWFRPPCSAHSRQPAPAPTNLPIEDSWRRSGPWRIDDRPFPGYSGITVGRKSAGHSYHRTSFWTSGILDHRRGKGPG
jgi:hypothetical protein